MITDDRDAFRLAKKMQVMVLHTVDIFRALVARSEITTQEAFELTVAICDSPYERTLLEVPTSARDFQ